MRWILVGVTVAFGGCGGTATGCPAPLVQINGRCVVGNDGAIDDGGNSRDASLFDAAVDSEVASDSGPADARDGGTCAPSVSNLVITELQVRSQSGAGELGEWFEVHNPSDCSVDLTGLEIEFAGLSGSPTIHTVSSGLVAARSFFVFAQEVNPGLNHGVTVDYATSDVTLNNTGGSLTLRSEATVIDRVDWTVSDYRVSVSRQLDPGAADNSDVGSSSWCDSTAVYSSDPGGPYLGTPGQPNETCP